MTSIPYPERIPLANLPTPLQPLERTSVRLGVEVLVKRDDMTGVELSGNKVRKLEFLLAEARARGADMVITCGGEQSNHCRATALAAARVGMGSLLLLRTADPSRPPADTGNILLDRLAGADIEWIDMDDWRRRNQLMAEHAERLRSAGRAPYVIVEGGSNATGSWGYVRAVEELANDLAKLPAKPTTILYAAGSGGTGAGLVLGARLFGLDARGVRVTGICVCDSRAYFVDAIHRICGEFDAEYGTGADIRPDDIDIIEDYIGLGYGRARPEELEEARELARREAIIVDPTYTGKAYYGMVRELEKFPKRFGERVVFLHTGGIFGLFR